MKKILILCFVYLSASISAAQTNSPINQLSTEASIMSSVDKVFAQWDKADSPGCALAVIKDNKVVHERSYGMANLENNIPITSKSVFDIASTSKQFTAMAILLLSRQGKLSLDDDVRKHIPELPDFGTPITIRQLVHHTNGLRDTYFMLELAGWRYDDEVHEADIIKLISQMKELNHKPGAEYSYNNTGYSLLALIVKRASGQSLSDFTKANIFMPLGMSNTEFRDDHTKIIKNRTASYIQTGKSNFATVLGAVNTIGPNGVFTSIEDLIRWDKNFYDKKVGGEAGILQLLNPDSLNDGTKLNYAFGLRVDNYKGLKMIWHSGAGLSTKTAYYRFPDQNLSIILLCNLSSVDVEASSQKVADIYLAEQFKQIQENTKIGSAQPIIPYKISERELTAAEGVYFNSDSGLKRRLYVKDGKLFFSRNASNESEISPISENRFLMLNVPNKIELAFESKQLDQYQQMVMTTNGGNRSVYERVKDFSPNTPAQLSEFTGNYYSKELNTTFKIEPQNTELVLQRERGNNITMKPLVEDVFNHEYFGFIKFQRDSQRRILGFTFTNRSRGVRRLKFLR